MSGGDGERLPHELMAAAERLGEAGRSMPAVGPPRPSRRRSGAAPGRAAPKPPPSERRSRVHPQAGDRASVAATAPNSPPERTDGRSPPPAQDAACTMTAERPHDPAAMAAGERLREVAEILAAGLLRLRAKRFPSRINGLAENSLDFGDGESVSRPTPRRRRGGGAR